METDAPALPAVPLANLYYLLCYATNRPVQQGTRAVAGEDAASPVDLLAQVLVAESRRLRLRGVPQAYRREREDTRAPRGRLVMCETIGRALLPQGRVHCERSELTPDVPLNRALKAGLRALSRDTVRVPLARRRSLWRELVALAPVSDCRLDERLLARVAAGRLEPRHRSLLALLELVRLGLPRPHAAGRTSLPDFSRQPQAMGLLFEGFVRGFLRREQQGWAVSRRHIPWRVQGSEAALGLVPRMECDVLLTAPHARVLVECKFTSRTLARARGGACKLKSGHLYQLGTYLSHLRSTPGPPVQGLLLYAQVERPLDLHLVLDGRPLRVCTLDLSRPWDEIHTALLALVGAA